MRIRRRTGQTVSEMIWIVKLVMLSVLALADSDCVYRE